MDPLTIFGANFAQGAGQSIGRGIFGDSGGPFVGGSSSAQTFGTTLDGSGWIVNVQGTQTGNTASPVRTTDNSPKLNDTAPYWGGSVGGGAPLQAGAGTIGAVLLLSVALGMLVFGRRRKG
jgi:hypothetical protein